MVTKVSFETATFSDAVKKACRVAPSKGAAFDKSAGVIIEVNPDDELPVVLHATDTQVFYKEWVDAVAEGAPVKWRVPSAQLSSFIGSLPISSGSMVSIEEILLPSGGKQLLFKCGKTKAKFNIMMHEDYPRWDVFDPDELAPVSDLGGKISLVEWAAHKSDVNLKGVLLGSEFLLASDRIAMALAKIDIPNLPDEGVMVPSGILGGILKRSGEVKIGFTDNQVLLMPDATTQIRAVMLDVELPKRLYRIIIRERPYFVEVPKEELAQAARRTLSLASSSNRMPTMRLFLGKEKLSTLSDESEEVTVTDSIALPGQADHPLFETRFDPKYITESLEHSPNSTVRIGYDPEKSRGLLYVDGGSGYEVWIAAKSARREEE